MRVCNIGSDVGTCFVAISRVVNILFQDVVACVGRRLGVSR